MKLRKRCKIMDTIELVQLTQKMITLFFVERDIAQLVSYFKDDATWIGPCEAEYFNNLEDMKAYFYGGSDAIPPCILDHQSYEVVSQNAEEAVVMGKYTVRTSVMQDMVVEVKQRCSFLYHNVKGEWKIHHLHTSNIYEAMQTGEIYFPKNLGKETYNYMQKQLKDKNEVIRMIDSNKKCGLKGSNDDASYSYFYVNEGLCNMLGYTYEEFMKMSNGCAMGAVYPPDLKQALQDCDDCFAQGDDYVTEYRMKAKDGSLMWVMDAGKKYRDEEGNLKINSILMDITELKTSQINLQVEQERYKIALENITDVMFEYEIEEDSLIKYVRKDYNRKNPVEKVFIEHYFTFLEKGDYIHLDDVGTLKAFLIGETKESIDIRLYQANGSWLWIQLHGSYITEDGKIVKCIGIWKDITEEKIRMETLIDLTQRDALTHLYHQKSVEEPIQNILKEQAGCVMMIMDIDNFKGVNDTYGHLNGNKVLLSVTDILLKNSLQSEFVCRIGGDEFMIFLPKKSAVQAVACADNILQQVKECCIEGEISVTMSIGIAYGIQHDSFARLFEKADSALYQAKNRGRNQYAIWQE